MAGVVALSGLAVASSRSLPGDPFYGARLAAEDARLAVASGPHAEGRRHLSFASNRLGDARGLTTRQDGAPAGLSAEVRGHLLETLAAMDDETRRGRSLLTGAFRDLSDRDALALLDGWADEQDAGLSDLMPLLPDGVQARAEASLTLLRDVGSQAASLSGVTCAGACLPSVVLPGTGPGLPGATGPAAAASPGPAASAAPQAPGTRTTTPLPGTPRGPAVDSPGTTTAPAPETSSPVVRTPPPAQGPLPLPLPLPGPVPTGGVPQLPLPTLPVPLPTTVPPLPVDRLIPGGLLPR